MRREIESGRRRRVAERNELWERASIVVVVIFGVYLALHTRLMHRMWCLRWGRGRRRFANFPNSLARAESCLSYIGMRCVFASNETELLFECLTFRRSRLERIAVKALVSSVLLCCCVLSVFLTHSHFLSSLSISVICEWAAVFT